MTMSPLEHIQAQRRPLLKMLLYGSEAAVICFAGMWLLFDNYTLTAKLLVSVTFGLGVLLIGVIAVIVASMTTAREIEQQRNK